jgi:hypothetical protein
MKPTLVILTAVAIVAAGFAAAAPAANDKEPLPGFHSPTGNIRCLYVAGRPSRLLCSIRRAYYAKQLQARCLGPTGAGVDWHGFSLAPRTRGMVLCSGGILYSGRPSYVNLPYGKSWRQGPFTCFSRIAGVTCRNRTGHGLFVSRSAWRIW